MYKLESVAFTSAKIVLIFKPGVCQPVDGERLVSYNYFRPRKYSVHVCVRPKAINN